MRVHQVRRAGCRLAPLSILLALSWAVALAAETPGGASSGAGSAAGPAAGSRGVMLVDFESGSATLTSYPDEDLDPDDWAIQSGDTYGGSSYALRVWGNTWKQLAIDPYALTRESVLQAALKSEERGELQAIGFGDGSGNELFYVVSGSQVVLSDRWNVVYQGIYPQEEWDAYLLAVGRDWFDTWGYEPVITSIVFVNDRDGSPGGITLFDEVYDVTADLPVAPTVTAHAVVGDVVALPPAGNTGGERLYRVDVDFEALVYDPDSNQHTFQWDFGDGASSTSQNPSHSFTAVADYTFTIAVDVTDDTGLFGRDTCQVSVEPGTPSGFRSINFTGDVFTGRAYESQGGLIQTHGVEYLFEFTREILGDAADVTMVNAECAFTNQGTPHPTKSVVFRTRPENIAGLVYAGVDVASSANNHIVDYGLPGLLQSMDVFAEAGIVYGGAGVNEYFATQPCYYTEDGIRLGFVNMCNRTGRQYNEQPFLDAGCDKYGLAYLLQPNLERAIAQVDSVADILVCFPHSGEEYDTAPPEESGAQAPGPSADDPPEEWGCDPWTTGLNPWGVRPGPWEVDADQLARAAAATHPDPELCPPFVPVDQARDVRFRIWPGMSDRELRRHAIDLGADAVINSHPHVLQGFEVYQGTLIAHSLGNFLMDLYYPETMPTIVLHALFDKEGIYRWTFKPAFIDHYIPVPSHTRLAREIIDRLADYSRQLGAVVGADYDAPLGMIFLDPAQATPVVTQSQGEADLVQSGSTYWVSEPIELAGQGNLSKILAVAGVDPQSCEVCWGREVLWFGRYEMEEEGHHMWLLNSQDEWIDAQVFHEGGHSLCLHRDQGAGQNVVNTLEKHLPAISEGRYSLCGWMKTDNSKGAKFSARFYNSRYTWNQLTTEDMGTAVNGTMDWTYYTRDFTAPEAGIYFNLRTALDPPTTGEGYAWFDDIRVVEWLDWQPLTLPLDVPYPNNYRFVQVRVPDQATTVTMSYEETRLTEGGYAAVEATENRPTTHVMFRGAGPNPVRTETALRFRLDQSARVSLRIFDLSGRLVATLARDDWKQPGWHNVHWDASRSPAGVYFARLTVEGHEHARKVVVMR
jgi:poly-gamma-glutamate capsule biosynthesis protein CapA/YwtB (metallophosphatase superfamily)